MTSRRAHGSGTRKSGRGRSLRGMRLALERLEARELLSFGSLVQVTGASPFTNTSDIAGQSGTNTLNSEVEPYIAVDPTNPAHLVGVTQQDRWSNGGSRGIVASVSTDAGNTWTSVPIPGATAASSPSGSGAALRASDPWVSIGPDGTVYAAYLELDDPNLANPRGVFISTSTDGGYTWANPVAAITNPGDTNLFDDKDSITANPTKPGEAYVVWDRLNFSANSGPAMFSKTTNGGQTWSAPQAIYNPTGPAGAQTIGNVLQVLPSGVLVDVTIHNDYQTNADTITVVRSTDDGVTWSGPITVSGVSGVGVSDPQSGAGIRTGGDLPEMAVDPRNGNLYAVWGGEGRFNGISSIAFSMSTDGGLTWTAPIRANQTPTSIASGNQQAFTPAVAVGANGTVAVSYYDFRNNTSDPTLLTDRWVAFANPAQGTLSFGNEQRLTNTSFDELLAPNAEGYFLGDYEGLANGGSSSNTFGDYSSLAVSSSDPTSIFFRGVLPPNTLSVTYFSPPLAVEGRSFSGTLATFADSSLHPDINTYTAVVTWGDGGTSTLTAANGGIVSNGSGAFNVVGSHTYAEESSGLPFSVQVTDNGGGSASASATVTVADAALTASGTTFTATQNSAVSGVTVATFTDADPAGTTGDYSASVNWGDSDTTASVNIVPDAHVSGQFDVIASKSHPYAAGGNYTVVVNISDTGGATATASSTAIVAIVSGTWTQLSNSLIDPFGGETMLLLTDGTIMVQGGGGNMSGAWYRLSPDAAGSYINGTWSTLASMSTQRLYYGSQVLPNGNVVVIGGEYTGPNADRTLTNTGEMYNPTTNTWTAIAPDPYMSQLGDVQTMLLPNGNILVGDKLSTQTDIYNPTTNTWTQGPNRLYGDINDEESWVKLPDNKIISYDIWSTISNGIGQAQLYNPTTNQWMDAGTVPVVLSTAAEGHELGPCLRLPDGRVLFTGSTGATALYSEATNTWTAGPTMPGGYVPDDAPGVLTPDGQVIFVADQGGYNSPSALFEYNPTTNTITALAIPDGNLASQPAFVDRMLVLPSGQVLFCDSSNQMWVYTPPGQPQSSWRPVVNSVTLNNNNGGLHTLTGTGLNGISAGAAYGDDAVMDENYPIIRLTSSTGQVYYARTTNWSYTGVGPGTTETVQFTLPAGMPAGTYTLQEIGAGIASSGFVFNALTLTSFTPPTNVFEGASAGGTLATFTDADASPNINTYTAVVTWGDGTVDTLTAGNGGIVSNGGNSFKVVDSHTYAEESSGRSFSIQITDQSGSKLSSSATVVVADAALTGTLTPPAAVEGQAFSNVTVFHFTDADSAGTASDYTAVVTLGNGSSVTLTSTLSANGQIVAAAGGGFDVKLSYTYAEELSNATFSVQVTDAGGATTSASTSNFSVADAALTAGSLTPPVAVEGQAFSNVTVFHFTDADPAGTASDYTAVVTLGNGSSVTLTSTLSANGQIVAAAGGGFDVKLSYTYAEELSNATFSVQVTDAGGATTSASTSSFSVADAALTASPATVSTTEGSAVSGVTVATFTDADPAGTASDYSATVTWGDGDTTASVSVVADPNVSGRFDVVASKSHPYAEGGSYAITVVIHDAGGASAMAQSTATVADLPLTASGANFTATEGSAFSGTVATFTDADTGEPLSSYAATINWGDGTTSTGTIQQGTGSQLKVTGGHTYTEGGSYHVTVNISDTGGASAQAASTATVNDAALSGSAVSFNAVRNRTFTGTVATFTDANPFAPVSDFTATINWGDGSTSTGTVSVNPSGGFQVTGSHAYKKQGAYTFSVTINDKEGATLTVRGTATVANQPSVKTGSPLTPADLYWAALGSTIDPATGLPRK